MRYAQAAQAHDHHRPQHSATAPSSPVDLRRPPPPPAKRRPASSGPRHHRPSIPSLAAPGFLKGAAAGNRKSRRLTRAAPLTAADVSQEDALWFSRLPEKVKRGQFSLEEQQLLAPRAAALPATPSPTDAADALFEQLRTARAARAGHPAGTTAAAAGHPAPRKRSVPSLDSTHSSDSDSPDASDRDSPVTDDDDHDAPMDAALLDRFRWLGDARDEPPLDLALDDYHLHVAATAEPPTTKAPLGHATRPSYRRARSIAGIAWRGGGPDSPTSPTNPRPRAQATRSPVEQWGSGWAPAPAPRDAYQPPPPPPAPSGIFRFEKPSPVSGPHAPMASSALSAPALPEPPPRRPSLDAAAAHYLNPEARRQLRLYLATPSKFDEALEFGFPALRPAAGPAQPATDEAAAPARAQVRRPSLPEPRTTARDLPPAAPHTRGKPPVGPTTTSDRERGTEEATRPRHKRIPTLRARLEAYPSSSTLSSRPAHRRSHSLDAAAQMLSVAGGRRPRTTFLDDGTTTTSSVAGRSSREGSAAFLPVYYSLPTPTSAAGDDDTLVSDGAPPPPPAPPSALGPDAPRLDLSPSTPSHSRTNSAATPSCRPGGGAQHRSVSSFASFADADADADAVSDVTATSRGDGPRRRSAAPAFPSVSSLHTAAAAAADPALSPTTLSPPPDGVHPLRLHPAAPPAPSPSYSVGSPLSADEDDEDDEDDDAPSPTTSRAPLPVPPTSRGRDAALGVAAPREMTLRVTLTRPDLRDPDAAWGAPRGPARVPAPLYVGPGSGAGTMGVGTGAARRRPSLRERMGMEKAALPLEPWGAEEAGRDRAEVGGLRRLLSRRW